MNVFKNNSHMNVFKNNSLMNVFKNNSLMNVFKSYLGLRAIERNALKKIKNFIFKTLTQRNAYCTLLRRVS